MERRNSDRNTRATRNYKSNPLSITHNQRWKSHERGANDCKSFRGLESDPVVSVIAVVPRRCLHGKTVFMHLLRMMPRI